MMKKLIKVEELKTALRQEVLLGLEQVNLTVGTPFLWQFDDPRNEVDLSIAVNTSMGLVTKRL